MKTRLTVQDNQIQIFIEDLPHLTVKQDELVMTHAYIHGTKARTFHIDFILKTRKERVSYDTKEKWISILKLLKDQNLYQGELP